MQNDKFRKLKIFFQSWGFNYAQHPDAGNNWDHELGIIIWKGTLQELIQSEYYDLIEDWDEDSKEIAELYNLVIVKTVGWDGGPTLYGYDEDPCSCVVFQK